MPKPTNICGILYTHSPTFTTFATKRGVSFGVLHKKGAKITLSSMIKPNFWRFPQTLIDTFGDISTTYGVQRLEIRGKKSETLSAMIADQITFWHRL